MVSDSLIAPMICISNVGFAAINTVVGGSAWLVQSATQMALNIGFGLPAEISAAGAKQVSDHRFQAARESLEMAVDAGRKLLGNRDDISTNLLLSRTIFDQGAD